MNISIVAENKAEVQALIPNDRILGTQELVRIFAKTGRSFAYSISDSFGRTIVISMFGAHEKEMSDTLNDVDKGITPSGWYFSTSGISEAGFDAVIEIECGLITHDRTGNYVIVEKPVFDENKWELISAIEAIDHDSLLEAISRIEFLTIPIWKFIKKSKDQ